MFKYKWQYGFLSSPQAWSSERRSWAISSVKLISNWRELGRSAFSSAFEPLNTIHNQFYSVQVDLQLERVTGTSQSIALSIRPSEQKRLSGWQCLSWSSTVVNSTLCNTIKIFKKIKRYRCSTGTGITSLQEKTLRSEMLVKKLLFLCEKICVGTGYTNH
jgi:hypothetical protein